jgi:hypothetical protein
MATDIQIAGTSVTFGGDWEISVPTSPIDVAPSATITTDATETVTPNDTLDIIIDGTTVFSGRTRSGGTKSTGGGVRVEAAHPAREFFEEDVSLSLTTPTAEQVLNATLTEANSGGQFTLSYLGSNPTLNDDYNVTDRSVKRVWKDMMDRTDNLWWVDPAGSTITVNGRGAGGRWQAIDTQTDRAAITSYDSGNIDTVRNVVTVVAAGGDGRRGTFLDSASVDEYGRRPAEEPYKVSYINSFTELQAMANELFIPDPLPEGELRAGVNVGNVTDPLVNQTLDITDDGLNINADGLIIEQQTIQQDSATIRFGGGQGTSIESRNRTTKSRADNAPPGTVISGERLDDNSVDTEQLVDASVIEQKLDDLSVSTNKLQDNAVINGKLDDLSVSETKIQDNSIATPKLQAEAVTAAKILADTITANEIAAGTITATEILADTITANEIAADTITALEIAANTLTANEIDTLDLDTNTLTITDDPANPTSGIEWSIETFGSLASIVTQRPFGSTDAYIGLPSARFAGLWGTTVGANQATFGGDVEPADNTVVMDLSADADITFNTYLAGDEPGSSVQMAPSGDGRGRVGTTTNAFKEMVTRTLLSDSVDPIDGDATGQVGNTNTAWSDMYAYNFIDADTGSALSDGGDVLAGIQRGDRPPEHCRECDEDGSEVGIRINDLTKHLWEICTAQQERVEELEDTVSDLEQRLTRLEEQV